jgi:hypothetical protein
VIVAHVDDVGFGAGEDQIVEGADFLEALEVPMKFLDVLARGVGIHAEDFLLEALHRLSLKGEAFSSGRGFPAAQRGAPP